MFTQQLSGSRYTGGLPARTYEFRITKLSSNSGSYSKNMISECKDFGMKPVCEHRAWCQNDKNSLYIGQNSYLAHGYYRRYRWSSYSRWFPTGFANIRNRWNGLCAYTGNANRNYAVCNVPSNGYQWRHPGQYNPGFVCGRVKPPRESRLCPLKHLLPLKFWQFSRLPVSRS